MCAAGLYVVSDDGLGRLVVDVGSPGDCMS